MKRSILFLSAFVLFVVATGCKDDNPVDPTPKNEKFKVTSNKYSETADLNAAVTSELGSNYRMADWNDIVAYCDSLTATKFISDFNIPLGEENSLMVTRDGQHFYGTTRHYYISRFDKNLPGHYLEHASIENSTISLGSWMGLNMPILCIKVK